MPKVLRDLHKTLTNRKIPLVRRAGGLAVLAFGALVALWVLSGFYGGALHEEGMVAQQGLEQRAAKGTTRGGGTAGMPGRSAPAGAGYDVSDAVARDEMAVSNSMPAPQPPAPEPGYTPGEDAEAFEVTEYDAYIETRARADVCGRIGALKSRTDVIFEEAREYEEGCTYRFKVRNEQADAILDRIEAFDPEELTERTYTIKQQIDYYLDEAEILERELAGYEEALAEAEAAYQELLDLATAAEDAESVAQVIDSRVQLIERMTQKRLSIQSRLDRLAQQRADQMDRLAYTFFTVSVREDLFFDLDALGDSWKAQVKALLGEANAVVQGVTVNLLGYALRIAQLLLYLFLLILIGKYAWRFGREFIKLK